MKISNEEIKKAIDVAYAKAGQNAYFGNGFEAGVKYAQEQFEKGFVVKTKDNDFFEFVLTDPTYPNPLPTEKVSVCVADVLKYLDDYAFDKLVEDVDMEETQAYDDFFLSEINIIREEG